MNGPVIHGKTDIVLKNVKTGLVERFHSENTFQANVLANAMRSFGQDNANPYANSGFVSREPWKNLVGGLFLFKDAIPVGTEFMPAGNVMVGQGSFEMSNGSQVGDPIEMGSWSNISSASRTAITQVYDFTTEQGNGQIGCVCLTSRMGGAIGYGNSANPKGTWGMGLDQSSRGTVGIHNCFYNGEVFSGSDISSGVLTINARKAAYAAGSVFAGYSRSITFDLATVGNPYNIQDGNGFHFTDVGGGIFRFVIAHSRGTYYNSPRTVAPGGTLYYYEFNANNETLTLKQLTNGSQYTLINSHASWNYDYWDCDVLDKYYVSKTSDGNKWIILDLTTGAVVNELNSNNSSNYLGQLPRKLSPNLYTLWSDYGTCWIYDSVANTFKRIGISQDGAARVCEQLNAVYSDGLFHNPLYLATINNLQEPVTKTASKTMNVTYSLIET